MSLGYIVSSISESTNHSFKLGFRGSPLSLLELRLRIKSILSYRKINQIENSQYKQWSNSLISMELRTFLEYNIASEIINEILHYDKNTFESWKMSDLQVTAVVYERVYMSATGTKFVIDEFSD